MSVLITGDEKSGVGVEVVRQHSNHRNFIRLALLPYPAAPRREELSDDQAVTLAGMLVCAAIGGYDVNGVHDEVEALVKRLRKKWQDWEEKATKP